MIYLFRLFLIVLSILPAVIVFIGNKMLEIGGLTLDSIKRISIAIVGMVIIWIFSYLSLKLCKYLPGTTINQENSKIESASDNFLPSFLGYFFVSLSAADTTSFIIVFAIIVLFNFFSKNSYFNPLYLMMGYSYYFYEDATNSKCLLISKQRLKGKHDLEVNSARRINDYIVIELEAK